MIGASMTWDVPVQRILQLQGWRRRGAALVLGALSILAMAPFFAWPTLLVTLPGLVLLIDAGRPPSAAMPSLADGGSRRFSRLRRLARTRSARAFGAGWWFAFGYHLAGLFWIGEAFLVEAETFAVLMPFAVTLMPAGLALFWGAATAVADRFWRPGLTRVLVLAVSLAIAEWLRGHILSGFPWNILGYALTWPAPLMQTAAVFGIYGLTLLTVLVFALPGVALAGVAIAGAAPADRDRQRPLPMRVAVAWPLASAMTMLLLTGLGWHLQRTPAAEAGAAPVRVRIVQPSVPQREKWQPQNQERIFREHLELSHRAANGRDDGANGVQLIVWPEAAMPFVPLRYPPALAAIGRMLPAGAHLAAGALRIEDETDAAGGLRRRVFNSLLVFGAGGSLVQAYDKIHLVPFGEYLPLQAALEAIGLEQLSRLRGGFAAGIAPRPLLEVPGLPKLGPLVCYEAIFPATIVQGTTRPAALVNVTNDGWFGNTTGPRQHLHQARVRAVEEGLPILRAANNGISAIIDGHGQVLGSLGMNAVGTIDGTLPQALPPPVYSRFGDWLFLAMLLIAIITIFGTSGTASRSPAEVT